MRSIEVHLTEHGCFLGELRFPAFTFCMGQRLIKVMYERKLTIWKRFDVSKNASIHLQSGERCYWKEWTNTRVGLYISGVI